MGRFQGKGPVHRALGEENALAVMDYRAEAPSNATSLLTLWHFPCLGYGAGIQVLSRWEYGVVKRAAKNYTLQVSG